MFDLLTKKNLIKLLVRLRRKSKPIHRLSYGHKFLRKYIKKLQCNED